MIHAKIGAESILDRFGPDSFDVVTAIASYHHFHNILAVAEQVKAVLKPGGIHVVVDNFYWNGNALQQALSRSWISLYSWVEGNGYFNGTTFEDTKSIQENVGLKFLGKFKAPLVIEGMIVQKPLGSMPLH